MLRFDQRRSRFVPLPLFSQERETYSYPLSIIMEARKHCGRTQEGNRRFVILRSFRGTMRSVLRQPAPGQAGRLRPENKTKRQATDPSYTLPGGGPTRAFRSVRYGYKTDFLAILKL